MEKSVPNQFINQLNNFLLFGQFQIFIMKRLLLLLVLAFCCANVNAQEVRATQGSSLMEVDAYLAYLRSTEVATRNLSTNSNRLEKLLKEVQPAIYYLQGEVRPYGEIPVALFTDSSSLSGIDAAITAKETFEIITIRVSQNSELNTPIDLGVLSNFPNAKYVYILSTVDTTPAVISNLVRNNNARFGVFYKIDKGS